MNDLTGLSNDPHVIGNWTHYIFYTDDIDDNGFISVPEFEVSSVIQDIVLPEETEHDEL